MKTYANFIEYVSTISFHLYRNRGAFALCAGAVGSHVYDGLYVCVYVGVLAVFVLFVYVRVSI